MAAFEDQYIYAPGGTWNNNIKVWRHFIDDVLLIWEGDRQSLDEFLEWLNSRNPLLLFTSTITKENLPFLDLTIFPADGGLQTTMFRKLQIGTVYYLSRTLTLNPSGRTSRWGSSCVSAVTVLM